MQAEIVTTGTELLLGQIVDTNAAHIAAQLTTIGLNMFRKTTVGDNEVRLAQVLREARDRSEIIIITGGLGPTVDDITREAVARATDRELVCDPELLRQIEERFRTRGRPMSPNNRRQAFIPAGAIPIENPQGTAPAFIVETERGGATIALPGVPREMRYLMEKSILPYLRQRFGLKGVIKIKILHTCAAGESTIDGLIGDLMRSANPTVGLSAHPGQTDVRIAAKAADDDEALGMIGGMEAQVRKRLGGIIFGTNGQTLEGVVAEMLRRKGKTLALLETNTGGLLAARLTAAGGELSFFVKGLVLMGAEHLSRELDIPLQEIEGLGLASEELARETAERLRARAGADWALAVLGTTGPAEEVYSARHGITWLALASEQGVESRQLSHGGRTALARAWTGNAALDMIRRNLLGA